MMTISTEPAIEKHTANRSGAPAPFACIELDRFCADCGYNLRTLAVHRDERTGIAVVRCTECGRFQSANDASTVLRPWLDRLTLLVLGVWMLFLIATIAHLCLAEGAISYATLDELTEHAGASIQRIGNTTIRNWVDRSAPLEVDTAVPYYRLFVGSVLLGSFSIAFVAGMFAVIAMPHWRRAAYAGLLVAMPAVAGTIVTLIWRADAPHLLEWGLPYIAAHAAAQLAGGIVGITAGRPLARLAVRVFLPPGIRPRLAFLWLADGKPMPRPEPKP